MAQNLNHLALFDAVAQAGSVTAGAQRLMVSQPAVSKQLKQLERALGVRLFDRTPKGIRLTEPGQLVAGYARRLVALSEDLDRALADLTTLRSGHLRVGATPTLATYLLPDLLVRFRTAFPAVRLHVETGNTPLVAARVASADLDLGLCESPIDDPRLDIRTFAHDDLVPIAPPNHPLARKRAVRPETFLAEPFIVHEPLGAFQSIVERALAGQGLSVKPALTLASTEAIKRAVAAGLGVAIVSRLSVQNELAAGRLAAVRVHPLSLHRPLYRAQLKGRRPSPAAAAFLELFSPSKGE